ncbi:unnamed protein product [Leptidea sinapis]|uniref:Uncharacterized protein n=1 Tax=Leptidea sinapis TaxID=189913 RepID=A0A5E4R3P1_9NEOP|nr:unnamed protein product [Leptidea sinapis]
MIYVRSSFILITLLAILKPTNSDPISHSYKHVSSIPNPRESLSGIASIFSPRMDFEQWKPLTGRGDPLRNDPTYDYEPPMLDKVHYWADDSRTESQIIPEKKSEVLVLGVSSRKPSISSKPSVPPKRHLTSSPSKYEDYSYKFNGHYPMTILVPPPPPPSGYKPLLFIQHENKTPQSTPPTRIIEATIPQRFTASTPEIITSFALQEANLIYQATDNNQTWFVDFNKTQTLPINTVSSDYAGWGPTTPFKEDQTKNYLYNIIPHKEQDSYSSKKYFFDISQSQSYQVSTSTELPIKLAFLPTALPTLSSTTSNPLDTFTFEQSTYETTTDATMMYEDTTTEIKPTTNYNEENILNSTVKPQVSVVDMLSSMISMPLVTDPERPEDYLYAHASENIQIFNDQAEDDMEKLKVMQTMQPPPSLVQVGTTPSLKKPYFNSHYLNSLAQDDQPSHTHDPYLNMRFTTPLTPTRNSITISEDTKPTADVTPMYLIIQGHSKVKTYGSKPKPVNSISSSDIAKTYETNEVKHLHPIKDKYNKKVENRISRSSKSTNLTSLIDSGIGSIEIQEADIGIKYDVSDGSDVPIEVYRKGIVESAEENYSSVKKAHVKRTKRQIDLSDLVPFDEDTLEEYVYNFFETRKNDTGLTGFIARAITSEVADSVTKDLEAEDRSHRNR